MGREGGATVLEADIIDHVRRRMGARQVPRRIYFVDRLPRTDSGKVRRAELPLLVGLDARIASVERPFGAAPPGSPLEGALAGLWAMMLCRDAVGRDDDFFLLGGDSLTGVQLLREVKGLFGVHLPLQALFGGVATVACMARESKASA